MHYVYPRYVNDGDTVYVPWEEGMPDGKQGQALRCKVVQALENHAIVESFNPKYQVRRLWSLEDLLVPPDAPNSSGSCNCNSCFKEAEQKIIDNIKL